MSDRVFRAEPLLEILAYVEAELTSGATTIAFRALDPDLGRGLYAGEQVEHAGVAHVHRPFRVWVDLAERLGLRLATPRATDDGLIALRFERIEPVRRPIAAGTASAAGNVGPEAYESRGERSAGTDEPRDATRRGGNAAEVPAQRGQERPLRIAPVRRPIAAGTASAAGAVGEDGRGSEADAPRDAACGRAAGAAGPEQLPDAEREWPPSTERYGQATDYARVSKLEDPGFVLDLTLALQRARLPEAPRVLDLGVNTGDELQLVQRVAPGAHGVGIDHSASALAEARRRFPSFDFLEADVSQLAGLGRFDLVISLNTLQSPGVDDRAVLRAVVQDHLAPTGAVILGLPNSRYAGGEVSYGARMKNFREPELGLLIKDVAFYRKYLQQHDRQVFVTGKHYLLVTGVAAAR